MTEALILDHRHIPRHVAHEWAMKAPGVDRDDLTGALNLALVKAAHAYVLAAGRHLATARPADTTTEILPRPAGVVDVR